MPYPICPYGFYVADPDNPFYYNREIDFYSQTVAKDGYALSLRKRIKDDVFQLYKWNHKGEQIVVFESEDLKPVLLEACSLQDENISFMVDNQIIRQLYGEEQIIKRSSQYEPHTVCTHHWNIPGIDSSDCPTRFNPVDFKALMRRKWEARVIVGFDNSKIFLKYHLCNQCGCHNKFHKLEDAHSGAHSGDIVCTRCGETCDSV